jgi:hypothetical protein
VIVEHWNGIPFEKPYQRVRDTGALPAPRARGREGQRGLRDVLGQRTSGSAIAVDPQPPILVAALREGMLRLAGREATARSSTGSRRTT